MPSVIYREAVLADVPALARIRAAEWESEQYWTERITGYMEGWVHPQKALAPRIVFVALYDSEIVGLVAGHLTHRFDCEGELEWIDVIRERRRQRIGSEMVRILARWFAEQNARRVCVDPGNPSARQFYARLNAQNLNRHWMFWPDISSLLIPNPTRGSGFGC
ncbi:MAG TPA: GNAT family N-acetyltransferase [Terriglobales bacterium]|nr:GNAT family N-acetyltransferase [Terriglobales bacterium]